MHYIVLLLALALSIISGCAALPPEPTVVYRSVLIVPPENLIADCLVEPPPDKTKYLSATDKDREKMLIALADKQMKNTFVCNSRQANLRLWIKEQKALYPDAFDPPPPTGEK